MVSMHEIIVKITGQDGLSPILAKNAQGLNRVNKNAGLTGNALKQGFEGNSATMLQARAGIDKYNNSLEAAKKQITGGLTPAMMGINTSKLEQMGIQMSATTKKTSNLKGHVTNLSNSLQGMGGIVSGLIGIGLGAWLKSTVDTAIHSQHEWSKLNAVLEEHGGNLQTAKKEITDLASKYGFARGEVREASRVFMQAGMNYQELTKNQGALTAAMALSVGTGRSVDESAKLLQKAYMGQGRALKELGVDIKKYKDGSKGVVDVNRLNQDILEKTASQLESHGKSGEAAIMRYNNAMKKLQTTIGEKLLPVLTPVLTTITDLIDKFVEAPNYVQYFTAGLIALASGSMILAPVISSLSILWGSLKKIGGFFNKKHKLDMDCGVCPPGSQLGDLSGNTKGKKGKVKGKTGRLGRALGRVPGVGRLSSLWGGMGNLGRLGSLGSLEGLGKVTGLLGGAARFAGPLGLAVTASTAGYGAYTGWNETQGPMQEKAKGAVGGAVEQLSFGLINKQQVMDGINWLYSQVKEIPGQISNFLKGLPGRISEIFKSLSSTVTGVIGWLSNIDWAGMIGQGLSSLVNLQNNILKWLLQGLSGLDKWLSTVLSERVVSGVTGAVKSGAGGVTKAGEKGGRDFIGGMSQWIKNNGPQIADTVSKIFLKLLPLVGKVVVKIGLLIGKKLLESIKRALGRLWAYITKPFRDAWNTAKDIVNKGIDTVLGAFGGLPGQIGEWMKSAADTVKYWAEKLGGPLLEIYCRIMGCSPGIIPAFRKLGEAIPHHIGKTLPHLEKLNSAMNIPNTDFKISTIPTLDANTLQSINIPLKTPESGYISKNNRVTNSRIISNDHTHYHEPITVNAKDMSYNEFKSTLLSVLDESNRRYVPP